MPDPGAAGLAGSSAGRACCQVYLVLGVLRGRFASVCGILLRARSGLFSVFFLLADFAKRRPGFRGVLQGGHLHFTLAYDVALRGAGL